MFRNGLFRARAGNDTGRAKGSDPPCKVPSISPDAPLGMLLKGAAGPALQVSQSPEPLGIGLIVTEHGLLLCQVASNPQCIS